ncbi:pilus assembly protein, partial [Altererythrobacter sp.]|nr:pilus assembly protein [Altererythrobacter sp.]
MIMQLSKRLERSQRGVAAVEMAIVLPVLSIMALASIDFVFGFTQKIELQQYAQAGADFVVANGDTAPTEAEVKAEVVAA